MASQSKQRQILGLIGWLVVTFAASALGAVASIQAKSFYSQLVQPAWAPPPWIFGPVWTILYALMAISAWLVWRSGGFRTNRTALSLFIVQLLLNALWSWLFFAWHRVALGHYSCHPIPFLARTSSCWRSSHSVPVMGRFCICPQLLSMET
jgi:benzodiazapine receptor